MDKMYFTFEEWSGIINRIFSPYKNLNQILHQFQSVLEKLCKANQAIKPIKENLNRITMTTLIECIVINLLSLDKHFDDKGRHVVEEKLQK